MLSRALPAESDTSPAPRVDLTRLTSLAESALPLTTPLEDLMRASYELKHSLTRTRVMSEALSDGVIPDDSEKIKYLNAICAEVSNLDNLASRLIELTRRSITDS